MEPEEFAMLVAEGNAARNSLGNEQWSIQGSEMESRRLRRSLYVVEDVKAGEKVTKQNIRAIRPGYGLAPKNMEQILEMTFVKDVKKGTPMSWEFVEVRP
jgi:sialic acid synthase SpsE